MNAALSDVRLDLADSEVAREASRIMSEALDRSRATTIRLVADIGEDGRAAPPSLEVPPTILKVLSQVLALMASQQSFSVHPNSEEVTTKQAAELLGVSRPFFVALLDKGDLAYRLVGRHRRVLLADVLKYGETMKVNRRSALEELTRASDDARGYDL